MINTSVEKKVVKGKLIIRNDRGLHTRPSTELVKCASSFRSEILLTYHKMEVNAKSLLGILMLAANKGARIQVVAKGEDSEEAIQAVVDLAKNNFYVSY